MAWLINFCDELLKVFNALKVFMSTPIEALSTIIGYEVTPLSLVSTFLVTFLLTMLVLRVVRG